MKRHSKSQKEQGTAGVSAEERGRGKRGRSMCRGGTEAGHYRSLLIKNTPERNLSLERGKVKKRTGGISGEAGPGAYSLQKGRDGTRCNLEGEGDA